MARSPVWAGRPRMALLRLPVRLHHIEKTLEIMKHDNPRRLPLVLALVGLVTGTCSAIAQDMPNQSTDDWRPMVYSDLSPIKPTANTAAYAELWEKEILSNDQAYVGQGDTSYQTRNAPASEAHYVVRSPIKAAVLSVLDTATGCTLKYQDSTTGNVVKMCPMVTAIYQGGNVTTTRGRQACFLELAVPNQPSDPNNTVAYASYDKASKSMKLGVIVNHQPIKDCAQVVPLYPLEMPTAGPAN